MLRLTFFAAAALAFSGCHPEPQPMAPATGELPPLPPASGTPVGYLLDNATSLELTDDQITKLRQIDISLSARNEGIATQLREIEKPQATEPTDPKAPPQPPPNMAPGAQPIQTTADASKLHDALDANTKDALERAFALLEPSQQGAARTLLSDRGISSPTSPLPTGPSPADSSPGGAASVAPERPAPRAP